MATIMRSDFLPLMTPEAGRGFNAIWDKTEKELATDEQTNFRKRVFREEKTDNPFEKSMHLIGIPGTVPRIPEGTDVRYARPKQGPPVYATFPEYRLAVAMTRIAQEDDKSGLLARMIPRELGEVYNLTQELQAAAFFENGFTAGAYPTIDGLSLFATNHPLVNGNVLSGATTWSNRLATDGALSAATLTTARAQGMRAANLSGRLRPIMYDTLIVAPEGLTYAEQLVASMQVLGSNNNDPNPSFIRKLRIIVCYYWQDPDMWVLVDSKNGDLVWWNRRQRAFDTHADWSSKVLLFDVSGRWSTMAGTSYGVLASRGAA